MSVITFMVGNGFDLACGLNSRYIDTYDDYVKSISKTENILNFKQNIDNNIPTWADFEMRMAEYAKALPSEIAFVECVNDYKEYLNEYLLTEQKHFHADLSSDKSISEAVRKEMERSFNEFYKGITPNDQRTISSILGNEPRIFKFICFNYTDILDQLVHLVFTAERVRGNMHLFNYQHPVIHIHGMLNQDVVLGVDNEQQLADVPYPISQKGKRKYIKPLFVEQYDNKRKQDAMEWLHSSNVVCIFGMSLGDSDLTWRKELQDWLTENERHHVVYYSHNLSCKKYLSTAVPEKMDDEEDAKEKLVKSIWGSKPDEELLARMMKQIHIPAGVNIFNVKETVKKANDIVSRKKEMLKNRPQENGAL